MKSRTIPLIFVFTAVVLFIAFFISNKYSTKNNSITRAKIVTPTTSETIESESNKINLNVETERYETFVPLFTGETLISTLTLDINNDAYDDEIIIIKKNGSQFLWIVPGIYNAETGNYERFTQLETNFSRTRAFSFSGMDITGDHRNALIYQGVDDSGDYVMEILFYQETGQVPHFESIGKFTSDGTIFIQQTERSESYELNLSKGESFSVWVYKSDKVENESETEISASNQIQQEFKWNPSTNHYELAQNIKVTASRLAAKELSRIQDGTIETFANFLNGLWYKTSNTDGTIRYIYFDYASKEVIQLVGDSQEVYEWDDSKLRHNGIYLTTVNSDIMTLHRRFDIGLINTDEIRINLRDDINLIIKETSMWDGQYKKMNIQNSFLENLDPTQKYSNELKNTPAWVTQDLQAGIAFDGICYKLKNNEIYETGVYALNKIGDYNVIQFRSDSEYSVLNEHYALEFGKKTITDTVNRKKVERIVTDYDSLSFTPIKINPKDCFLMEGRIWNMTKGEFPQDVQEEPLSEEEDINGIAVSAEVDTNGKNTPPKLGVRIGPKYFSPDGDGVGDILNIQLSVESKNEIKDWSFKVLDPNNLKEFWKKTGNGSVSQNITWDGRSLIGEVVQSATDYPYEFYVSDINGVSNTVKGFIQVDILVLRQENRLVMQVPSIIFRSDAADFMSDSELKSTSTWNGVSKGLDQATIDNNYRVLMRVSDILKKFRDYKITIEGNANNITGTAKEEKEIQKLSLERAEFVKQQLIDNGIVPSRLTAVGRGGTNPIVSANDVLNRWKNRRVEFILEKQ